MWAIVEQLFISSWNKHYTELNWVSKENFFFFVNKTTLIWISADLSPSDPFLFDPFDIQVDKAFEHLVRYSDCKTRNIRFCVLTGGKRGIYIREMNKSEKPSEFNVTIDPKYGEDICEYEEGVEALFIWDGIWVKVKFSFLVRSFSSR